LNSVCKKTYFYIRKRVDLNHQVLKHNI